MGLIFCNVLYCGHVDFDSVKSLYVVWSSSKMMVKIFDPNLTCSCDYNAYGSAHLFSFHCAMLPRTVIVSNDTLGGGIRILGLKLLENKHCRCPGGE